MIPAQIDYTSRDYTSLREDLIKVIQSRIPEWAGDDNSDFSVALVDAFSHMGDVMSYYIDRTANESQIQTTTKKSNLINFAELFGYKPSGPTPATAVLQFTNSTANTVTLPAGTQAYISTSLNDGTSTKAYFETSSLLNLAAGTSGTVDAKEGKTSNTDAANSTGIDPTTKLVLPKSLGTSNGYAYQELVIPNDTNIIDYSVNVYVGQSNSFTKWTYFENILDATPFTNAYALKLNDDGTTSVLFGDGINGAVPPSGQTISVIYRTSIGISGNIDSTTSVNYPNLVVSFIPGVGKTTTGISAVFDSDPVGGSNGETISSLRENISNAMITRNRAVTLNDYKYLANTIPGVGESSPVSDVYTSVTLYMRPYYDGTLTPGVSVTNTNAAISAITGSGTTVTVTTSAAHGFVSGSTVTITGVTPTAYNGTYQNIIVTDSTHFTYSSTTTGTATLSSANAANSLAVPNDAWKYVKNNLYSFLIRRMPVNTSLTINPPSYAPISLSMSVTIDNAYKVDDVKAQIAQIIFDQSVGIFSYGGFGFGAVISQSILQAAIMSIPGVKYVVISLLARYGSTGASDLYLAPNEIPVLYTSNFTLNTVGGIQ